MSDEIKYDYKEKTKVDSLNDFMRSLRDVQSHGFVLNVHEKNICLDHERHSIIIGKIK